MLENRKNIIIASIVILIISITTFFILHNYFEMNRELERLREEQFTTNSLTEAEDEGTEVVDNNEDELKNTILKNIQDKSKRDIDEALKLKPISGSSVSTLEEASDKVSNMLLNASITFVVALESVSGYMALVFIVIGLIGAKFSDKAPFVQKRFISMAILGPIIFILINYGPALLSFLSLGGL